MEKKKRERLTRSQSAYLGLVYGETTRPTAAQRRELAAEFGLTARRVQIWFQNRRAKEKRARAAARRRGELEGLLGADEERAELEVGRGEVPFLNAGAGSYREYFEGRSRGMPWGRSGW